MPQHNCLLDVKLPYEPTAEASAFAFLANLLPAINLKEHASGNERPFVPREHNTTAEPLFDCIARQLHRQDAPHLVLTGPTAIGKTETVRELARRCRCGGYPFLAEAALLWFDCSAIGPEDSRGCLESLLAVARERAIKELRPLCSATGNGLRSRNTMCSTNSAKRFWKTFCQGSGVPKTCQTYWTEASW